jgi:hypothetical protein
MAIGLTTVFHSITTNTWSNLEGLGWGDKGEEDSLALGEELVGTTQNEQANWLNVFSAKEVKGEGEWNSQQRE